MKENEPPRLADPISVPQAGINHPRQWILMKITGRNSRGYPEGHILAVSPERQSVAAELKKITTEGPRHLFMFWGARYKSSGPDVEHAARGLVARFNRAKRARGDAR